MFITDEDFCRAYATDPFEKLIHCLGTYMGLRRSEMVAISDGDMDWGGALRAIDEYRTSDLGGYGRGDDKLLQRRCRDGVLRG